MGDGLAGPENYVKGKRDKTEYSDFDLVYACLEA